MTCQFSNPLSERREMKQDEPLHTSLKAYDVPFGFIGPADLRQCIALFVIAEGKLLLDIE